MVFMNSSNATIAPNNSNTNVAGTCANVVSCSMEAGDCFNGESRVPWNNCIIAYKELTHAVVNSESKKEIQERTENSFDITRNPLNPDVMDWSSTDESTSHPDGKLSSQESPELCFEPTFPSSEEVVNIIMANCSSLLDVGTTARPALESDRITNFNSLSPWHDHYSADDYGHVSQGVMYIDSSIPGPGLDLELYEQVPLGCDCTGSCSEAVGQLNRKTFLSNTTRDEDNVLEFVARKEAQEILSDIKMTSLCNHHGCHGTKPTLESGKRCENEVNNHNIEIRTEDNFSHVELTETQNCKATELIETKQLHNVPSTFNNKSNSGNNAVTSIAPTSELNTDHCANNINEPCRCLLRTPPSYDNGLLLRNCLPWPVYECNDDCSCPGVGDSSAAVSNGGGGGAVRGGGGGVTGGGGAVRGGGGAVRGEGGAVRGEGGAVTGGGGAVRSEGGGVTGGGGCGVGCQNRVVQRGPRKNLRVVKVRGKPECEFDNSTNNTDGKVFGTVAKTIKTVGKVMVTDCHEDSTVSTKCGEKGYGVVTDAFILRGSFICEYAGELLGVEEAKKRFAVQEKENRSNYIMVLREFSGDKSFCNGALNDAPKPSECLKHAADAAMFGTTGNYSDPVTVPGQVTIIDPTYIGNIGRYLNHSCSPNVHVVPVRINSMVPVAAVFALTDVQEGEELVYDYGSVNCDVSRGPLADHLPDGENSNVAGLGLHNRLQRPTDVDDIESNQLSRGLKRKFSGVGSVLSNNSATEPNLDVTQAITPAYRCPRTRCYCGAHNCRGFLPTEAVFW